MLLFYLMPCVFVHSHALQAGAAEKEIPLYKHIAELAGNTELVSGASLYQAVLLSRGMQQRSAAWFWHAYYYMDCRV